MPRPFWINATQTPKERAQKYWLCRSFGRNSYQASRMMDWRLNKIERALGLSETTPSHRPTLADKEAKTDRLALGADGRLRLNGKVVPISLLATT